MVNSQIYFNNKQTEEIRLKNFKRRILITLLELL